MVDGVPVPLLLTGVDTGVEAGPTRLASWSDAVCTQDGVDPEFWFPRALDWTAVAAVKEVCFTCPVRESLCLPYAERTRPTYGVWAGFSAGQLTSRRIARERGVGVPEQRAPLDDEGVA